MGGCQVVYVGWLPAIEDAGNANSCKAMVYSGLQCLLLKVIVNLLPNNAFVTFVTFVLYLHPSERSFFICRIGKKVNRFWWNFTHLLGAQDWILFRLKILWLRTLSLLKAKDLGSKDNDLELRMRPRTLFFVPEALQRWGQVLEDTSLDVVI